MERTEPFTIGIIGGGQLGMMLIKYGIHHIAPDTRVRVLDPCGDCGCSCSSLPDVEVIKGSLTDENDLRRLCKGCDVVTWEIEHVNAQALIDLKHERVTRFIPDPEVLAVIQNKAGQKLFYQDNKIPTLPFCVTDKPRLQWDELTQNAPQFSCDAFQSFCVVYKDATQGYDGRGVEVVGDADGMTAFDETDDRMVVVEPYLQRNREISVIVAVSREDSPPFVSGAEFTYEAVAYEPVAMEFHPTRNVLHECYPAENLSREVKDRLTETALKVARVLQSPGLYAVEMFYAGGKVYVNETAPRVHNSGHHTIHSHDVSQFEMLARLLLHRPLQIPKMRGTYCMRNLFGREGEEGCFRFRNHIGVFPEDSPVLVDYNKIERPWRKIGHITHCRSDNVPVADVRRELDQYCSFLTIESSYAGKPPPEIGVVMGSRSDWSIMVEACTQLRECGVDYEVTVVSAHRTPDRLAQYAKTARERGLRAIIAGAGGSAHLPGMLAAYTTVPVIGVPIASESSKTPHAALWSIVQMPPGVPVACMAINGAKNAALFAMQITGHHSAVELLREEKREEVVMSARLE